MTASERVTDPASLPVLTVLVHPAHDPADRSATRVLRTMRPLSPWVPITGRAVGQLPPLEHNGVWGWRMQSIGEVLQVFNGEVR